MKGKMENYVYDGVKYVYEISTPSIYLQNIWCPKMQDRNKILKDILDCRPDLI